MEDPLMKLKLQARDLETLLLKNTDNDALVTKTIEQYVVELCNTHKLSNGQTNKIKCFTEYIKALEVQLDLLGVQYKTILSEYYDV